MAIRIAKRYMLDDITDEIAIDQKSDTGECVIICLLKSPRMNDLVHSTFFRRAKDLATLNHPGMTPLLDYGYDEQNQCYYLVYQIATGRSLNGYLRTSIPPFEWSMELVFQVIDVFHYLHLNNFHYGRISPKNIILDTQYQLPLTLDKPALDGFKILLGLKEPDEDDVHADIYEVAFLTATLLTHNPDVTTQELLEAIKIYPEPLTTFFECTLLEELEEFTSIIEAKRELHKALAQFHSKTAYYLVPTKRVTERLFQLGFIGRENINVAVDFLNDELGGEVFGKPCDKEWAEGKNYYLVTPRFRLLCAPDRESPERQLAIKTVECPSATHLVADRETGLSLDDSLQVTFIGKVPASASIRPLLEKLEEHRLTQDRIKKEEVAQKGNLETWKKVLTLQERLLNEFQLSYDNWELDESENAIVARLTGEPEELGLSEDDQLVMTSNTGRGVVVAGYFEELNGQYLKINLGRDTFVDSIAKQGSINLNNLQVKSILDRQKDAFRRLRFDESANRNLRSLLIDPSQLEVEIPGNTEFWDLDLDPSQKETISHALATRDIFLVQGPPGTGKTRTIVELTRQLLNDERHKTNKVLISSQSNVAVNHALSSLIKAEPGLQDRIARVGREEKAENTANLLIEQQIMRWSQQVSKKSQEYLEKKQKEMRIDEEIASCVGILDECDSSTLEFEKVKKEHDNAKSKYEQINAQYQKVAGLLSQTQLMRERANQLLSSVSANDKAFYSIMNSFEQDVLGWAETFLNQVSETAKLSNFRVDLEEKLSILENREVNLAEQVLAAQSVVHETLKRKFGVDISEYKAQRQWINQKMSNQQEAALRLGRLQKVSQEWRQRIGRGTHELSGAYINRCKVVGATCIGIAAKGEISDIEFDWVIIDEAGRATHPELLVPMVRGRKILLVGDHHQLPPILDRQLREDVLEEIQVSRKDLETSLFHEMITQTEKARQTLKTQYRMHPAIGNLISKCFYDGQLDHGTNVKNNQHSQDWCPTPVLWLSTRSLKNHQEHPVGHSFENLSEVEAIVKILDRCEKTLGEKNAYRGVGIIAGYMPQKHLLRQQMSKVGAGRWPHLTLEINTVDAYQGREMDYIIYSVVRSNTNKNIGFLRDERRLNVALSRAKELLIIVGDTDTVGFADTRHDSNPFFNVIKHIRLYPKECTLKDFDL